MTAAALLLMAGLLTKHFLFDFVFQTPYQYANKGRYGHPGGLLHAGLHAVATSAILIGFGYPLGTVALLAAAEFLIHYHIDWAKQAVVKRLVVGQGAMFWAALGFDQLLHNLTYVALVAVVNVRDGLFR